MAETVYLNDGSMEVILTDKGVFLERLIREKLGDDVARCFTEFVEEMQEDLKLSQDSVDEQERSADGYFQMCQDALNAFSSVLSLLNAPRLDRKALKAVVQSSYDDLYNNL